MERHFSVLSGRTLEPVSGKGLRLGEIDWIVPSSRLRGGVRGSGGGPPSDSSALPADLRSPSPVTFRNVIRSFGSGSGVVRRIVPPAAAVQRMTRPFEATGAKARVSVCRRFMDPGTTGERLEQAMHLREAIATLCVSEIQGLELWNFIYAPPHVMQRKPSGANCPSCSWTGYYPEQVLARCATAILNNFTHSPCSPASYGRWASLERRVSEVEPRVLIWMQHTSAMSFRPDYPLWVGVLSPSRV